MSNTIWEINILEVLTTSYHCSNPTVC